MTRIGMAAFTHYDSDPRVRREAEALVDLGHEVTVFSLRRRGEPRRRVLHGVELVGAALPRHRGSNPLWYLSQYVAFAALAMVGMTYRHLRRRYHIIHVHTMPDFMVFAALPAKLLGAKVILDMHDLMPELYASKFGGDSNHWLVRLIAMVERWSVAIADQVIAVHEPHRDAIVSHGNPAEKFEVIHNVPDERLFPPGAALQDGRPRRGPVRLVYHGTIAPRHGLDLALRALHEHGDELPDVHFSILGDGDDVPRLEALISELGLADRVVLRRGFVPVDQLLPHLVDADIGVVPVVVDGFTELMLPTKLLEYAQLGIPTICSRLPAVEHYFSPDQVLLFESGDVASLAAKIRELANDPGRRDLIARRALGFFDDHGWSRERLRLAALVDRVADNEHQPTIHPEEKTK